MSPIGFIGLGTMGKPMALHLLRMGYSLVVHDIDESRLQELAEAGAKPAECCAEVASLCDILVLMLPDGPDVEVAVIGSEGVLEGARRGSVVIDMSSIRPDVSRKMSRACEAAGLDFLDAPVSGNEQKAADGSLAIMVGGGRAVFARVLPVLKAMGSSVTLTGPVGAGNVTNFANQIMIACNVAAMGEALALAKHAGLDPEVVLSAVKSTLAGSDVLNATSLLAISRSLQPGFRISRVQEDLGKVLLAAESMRVPLAFTKLVDQKLVALINEGRGSWDQAHGYIQ